MYPVLFRIGEFPITSFGLMVFLSFVGGAWATGKMLERYGLSPALIWEMLALIAVSGIAGAKIYYLGLHWPELVANPGKLLFARDGLVWYGGLIGGVIAYYLQVRSRKLPVAVMFDATAPGLMLAVALGRIGCFLVGDDYGVYSDGPFAMAFPRGVPPSTAGYLRSVGDIIPSTIPDGAVVGVHPTQLYETAIVLVLFALLWRLSKRHLKPGQLFAVFMGLYSVKRFGIEAFRAKGDRFIFGFSTAQGLSILLAVAAVVIWRRQRSEPEWTPEAAPERVAVEANPRPAY